MVAVDQPIDDFRRQFPALILAEVFLDVLDLQRALLKSVLSNVILQMTLRPYPKLSADGCPSYT